MENSFFKEILRSRCFTKTSIEPLCKNAILMNLAKANTENL